VFGVGCLDVSAFYDSGHGVFPFRLRTEIIYGAKLNEKIKIIFIYLDRLMAVKLFRNLYGKMNQYSGESAIIN
jgi:hypothetical protein